MLLAQLIRDLTNTIPLPFPSIKALSPPPPTSARTLGSRHSLLLLTGNVQQTPSPLRSISPVGCLHALICTH